MRGPIAEYRVPNQCLGDWNDFTVGSPRKKYWKKAWGENHWKKGPSISSEWRLALSGICYLQPFKLATLQIQRRQLTFEALAYFLPLFLPAQVFINTRSASRLLLPLEATCSLNSRPKGKQSSFLELLIIKYLKIILDVAKPGQILSDEMTSIITYGFYGHLWIKTGLCLKYRRCKIWIYAHFTFKDVLNRIFISDTTLVCSKFLFPATNELTTHRN